jgi:hypothetical protein
MSGDGFETACLDRDHQFFHFRFALRYEPIGSFSKTRIFKGKQIRLGHESLDSILFGLFH